MAKDRGLRCKIHAYGSVHFAYFLDFSGHLTFWSRHTQRWVFHRELGRTTIGPWNEMHTNMTKSIVESLPTLNNMVHFTMENRRRCIQMWCSSLIRSTLFSSHHSSVVFTESPLFYVTWWAWSWRCWAFLDSNIEGYPVTAGRRWQRPGLCSYTHIRLPPIRLFQFVSLSCWLFPEGEVMKL